MTTGKESFGTSYQIGLKQLQFDSQGTENGGAGGESAEGLTAAKQFAEARTAPPGSSTPAHTRRALGQLNGLSTVGGNWSDVTAVKYDADDSDYRDYYSNSSGGSGNVTGRITGLAADGSGHVYAAGAAGGVWRSSTGGGNWTAIADALPSLSSGDLELNGADGSLWYATGEANTGGTSYVGVGRLPAREPRSGAFAPATASAATSSSRRRSTRSGSRMAASGRPHFAASGSTRRRRRAAHGRSRTRRTRATFLPACSSTRRRRPASGASRRRARRTRRTRTSSTTSRSTRKMRLT